MLFHTPQKHLKTIRETMFCDSAKTRSQNLINPVEYGCIWSHFLENDSKRTRKALGFSLLRGGLAHIAETLVKPYQNIVLGDPVPRAGAGNPACPADVPVSQIPPPPWILNFLADSGRCPNKNPRVFIGTSGDRWTIQEKNNLRQRF